MRRFKLTAIITAITLILGTVNVFAQKFSDEVKVEYKPTKEVKKEAKKYEKSGWKVSFGSMPMAEQMQRAIYFQKELDSQGNAKYAIGRGQSQGQYYDAARMQAMELARINVAQQLETSLTMEAENILGNEQGAEVASAMQTVQSGRSLVSQNLSQTIVVTEIYRELSNGNYEVQISIAAERAQATKAAKQAIRDELKKRGSDILNKLDEGGWNKE